MTNRENPDNTFRAEDPDMLLDTQEPAIRVVLQGFVGLVLGNNAALHSNTQADGVGQSERKADDETESDRPSDRPRSSGMAVEAATTKRPHQVYLIDGSRGAGKTYTLLTLELALKELTRYFESRHFADKAWVKKINEWIPDALRKLDRIRPRHSFLAHTLRIIFPDDLEDGDAVMEAIFAAMTMATSNAAPERRRGDEKERQRFDRAQKLNEKLRVGVAQSWYFAKRWGLEAIVRDATDYDDLVVQFESEARKAADRIETWRAFLEEYLEFHDAEMLVVMLDDSDISPKLTENILQAIRMYLDHPRIVSILAGNLKSMRISLLHLAMERLGSAVNALNAKKHPTAADWRRHEERQIEDLLEKILPPAQRIRVSRPNLFPGTSAENAGKTPKTEFEAVVLVPMTKLGSDIMSRLRPKFLQTKFRLAIMRELGLSDAPSPPEKSWIENYLAWWVFMNRYREPLQPRSVRQLKTWAAFYRDFGEAAENEDRPPATLGGPRRPNLKRLPVMLFDNPANFALIHRMSDDDERLPEWLRKQDLHAMWVGRRIWRINDRDIDEGSYTYEYLKYRHDVGIAIPVRDNADEIISTQLLPSLVGRRFMRRFFQPRQMPRRHRRLGMARWLDHAAVPSNCAYLHDVSKLPDVSLVQGLSDDNNIARRDLILDLQKGDWEADLCENWMELIEDRQDRPDDEHLIRYLREIVFEALRETRKVSSDALLMELDPPDAFEKRQYAVYEHFIEDELRSFKLKFVQRQGIFRRAAKNLRPDAPPRRDTRVEVPKHDDGKIRRPERMLALYTALVTDLRRAWHSIRIHRASPDVADHQETGTREVYERQSRAAMANRDRMTLLSLDEIKVVLAASDWSRAMLAVFSKDQVWKMIESFDVPDDDRVKLHITKNHIDSLFIEGEYLEEDLLRSEVPQQTEEAGDFDRWTKTLRSVGRAACDHWPVHDLHIDDALFKLEDKFFDFNFEGGVAGRYKLDIFDRIADSASKDEKKAKHLRRRRNARAARNFVWLLWGLAPSLPAIIHANVMSLYYEADLNWQAAKQYEDMRDDAKDVEKLRKDVDKLRKMAWELYERALGLTKDWGSLVGSLSVIIRYVKIKCLHLDAALFLEQMVSPEFLKGESAASDVVRFLEKKCGYTFLESATPTDIQQAGREAMEKLLKKFANPEGLVLAKDLAINPDVAPSSLFGDNWMIDLLQRDSIKADLKAVEWLKPPEDKSGRSKDDPLSVNGLFGETEQWLWASSRSLRKLRQTISVKINKLLQENPPPARTDEPT